MSTIKQITIFGTGLIGGSLALALRKHGFTGTIVGCDKPLVMAKAKRTGMIDLGIMEPRQAVQHSDVVVLATPVGSIIDLIERVGPLLPPDALLTDVGSTKGEVVARALAVFGADAARRFLPGHPMAGKESGGLEQATADLFHGAVWLFTPIDSWSADVSSANRNAGETHSPRSGQAPALHSEFLSWIEKIGARPITLDSTRHDRLCAWLSHLPQMISTALAASLHDEFGDDPDLQAIGGRALREMTRIASSPYSVWRDIALTNTANLEEAILRLEQRLAHLRENLKTRGLEEEFERAHRYKKS